MTRVLHCICALVAVVAGDASAQPATAEPTEYTLFVKGVPVGREEVLVRSDARGTTIVGTGRSAGTIVTTLRRVEFRYGTDGSPESFRLDASIGGSDVELRTRFENGTAITEGTQGDQTVNATQEVSPGSIVIPNGVFAGFAALAPRLAAAEVGDQFRLFLVPSLEVTAELNAIREERMQTGAATFNVRRHQLNVTEPSGTTIVHVTTAPDGSLVRVNVPTQNLDILRTDLAGVSSRTEVYSNPTDQAISIPAPGFNLAATITAPAAGAGDPEARRPAVALVPSDTAPDRDTIARGVPAMAQLAGALADAGFIVVRYDRRGTGQSGGRSESATLDDHAEDARTVVRWLSSRNDVDRRRIAVVGHGDGAWAAMTAAAREGRISALITLAASAATGADTVAERQQRQLDAIDATEAERAENVALQRRIHEAVLSGGSWDEVPPEMRRQADTPWFRSLLAFDPSRVLDDVDGAILIVHGDLDRELATSHAERLATIAREGDAESVDVLIGKGVTHAMTRTEASTSDALAMLQRDLDPGIATAVAEWLTRVLPPSKR
jgi:pimeloyl-ACP methyl ester carboxylesterase